MISHINKALWGPHLGPAACSGGGYLWDVAQLGQWPRLRKAEDLRQSILANRIFRTTVPGFPLDCSSSTSSSNRPQPAVSMSSKGIVVSSVEVTPGRSLHKVFGKEPVNDAEILRRGRAVKRLLSPPNNTAGTAGKHSWTSLPWDKSTGQQRCPVG